jgi:iron complex transport system ATP-binding protein
MRLTAQDVALAGRLQPLSLVLEPGQVIAICGPNGAGKSSLLSVLAGVQGPEAGAVLLGGTALSAMQARERARSLGYLAQGGGAAWDLEVEALVALGRLPWQAAPLQRASSSAAQDAEAVEEALTAMDLLALRHRPLSRLSGGERARAMLARVLAGQPRWILADEPLASLDLGHGLGLLAALRQAADHGAGVVLVLHDLALAMNHADRVLVLDAGRLVADGPPEVALAQGVIEQVWRVKAQWLGEAGARALGLGC